MFRPVHAPPEGLGHPPTSSNAFSIFPLGLSAGAGARSRASPAGQFHPRSGRAGGACVCIATAAAQTAKAPRAGAAGAGARRWPAGAGRAVLGGSRAARGRRARRSWAWPSAAQAGPCGAMAGRCCCGGARGLAILVPVVAIVPGSHGCGLHQLRQGRAGWCCCGDASPWAGVLCQAHGPGWRWPVTRCSGLPVWRARC
jgi:hypothetical protein